MHGMAFQPGTGTLYAIIGRYYPSLYTLDPITGAASFVSGLSHGYQSLEFLSDGTLLAGGDGALYQIDPVTGAETYIGYTGYGELIGLESVPTDAVDSYSFVLDANQSTTLFASGSGSALTLLASDGVTVLALGVAEGNDGQVIRDFIATSGGTYYVQVTRASRGDYSLVVTRDAVLDTESNSDISTAQALTLSPIDGTATVLGHVIGQSELVLNATGSGWYDGFGYHDPSNLNYFTGLVPGYAELRDFFTFDLGSLNDLAILSGRFQAYNPSATTGAGDGFYSDDSTETYTLFDVNTPVAQLLAGGSGLTGIFDDLGTGTEYGSRIVSAADNGTLVSVDLNDAALADLNAARGNAFALGGALTTLAGNAGLQNLFSWTFGYFNYPRQLVLSVEDSDFFRVYLAAGQTLEIETSTPAGGPGEFVNNLDPMIGVYDVLGTPLTSDDNSLDGRNASLTYTAGSDGTYYIMVSASDQTTASTQGEYVLSVRQTTSFAPMITADGEAESMAVSRIVSSEVEHPWCNRIQPADVSNDGSVSPLDALMIINSLNADGSRSLPRGERTRWGDRSTMSIGTILFPPSMLCRSSTTSTIRTVDRLLWRCCRPANLRRCRRHRYGSR